MAVGYFWSFPRCLRSCAKLECSPHRSATAVYGVMPYFLGTGKRIFLYSSIYGYQNLNNKIKVSPLRQEVFEKKSSCDLFRDDHPCRWLRSRDDLCCQSERSVTANPCQTDSVSESQPAFLQRREYRPSQILWYHELCDNFFGVAVSTRFHLTNVFQDE